MGSKLVKSVIFWLSLCLILSLGVFSFANFTIAKNETSTLISSSQYSIVQSAIKFLQGFIGSKFDVVNTVSQQIEKANLAEDKLMEVLELGNKVGNFALLYAGFEENGRMLRSNGKKQWPSDGYDPRQRGWYKQTVEAGKPSVTDVYITSTGSHIAVSFTSPFKKDGKLKGVVGSDVLLENLSKEILTMTQHKDEKILAIDAKGRTIISKDKDILMKESALNTELLKFFNNSKENLIKELKTYKFSENNQEMIAACLKDDITKWLICSVAPIEIYSKTTNNLLKSQLVLSIISIILIVVILSFILQIKLNPLKEIHDGLNAFFEFLHCGTKKCKTIHVKSKDELGQMANSINENIKNAESARIAENNFIVDFTNFVEHIKSGDFTATLNAQTSNPALNQLKHT
ncbi:PDC sensor domain-containing protein, partial [Campylobacter sp. MOP51]|uniref:PDC sensor domain-containing protein n=1 Tax=Campylobacter canis TaxID=3378588 RepID=UPI003C5B0AF8